MNTKQFHWLEIVEFLALGLGVIGLLVAIASGHVLFSLIVLTLGLCANMLNRLRGQWLQRKGLAITKQQLQRQLNQLNQQLQGLSLSVPISPPDPSPPPQDRDTDSPAIARLKEQLISIEQSLNTVIQYLNTQDLPERIEQLEQSYRQLSQDITATDSTPPSRPASSEKASPDLTFLQPTTKLPIVSPMTEVSPSLVIPEWRCLHTLTEHSDAVATLSISLDGQWLASGSWDQTLCLWELPTGTLKGKVAAHSQGLLAVVFLPDDEEGERIATGSFDQTIKLWQVEYETSQTLNLHLAETLRHHTGSVHSLVLSRNPLLLVSGSYDQTVKQWTLPRGEMQISSYDPLGAIYALAVDAPRRLIASAGGDGRVTLWQLESGEQIGFLAGNLSSVESLAISGDGQTLAAGCVDGTIKIWQLEVTRFDAGRPLQPVRVLKAHRGQVKALLFSEQEQILFSGGADGYLKVWHPSRREAITTLTMNDQSQGRYAAILSLAFDERGQLLIAGNAEGMIKIWQKVMSN